MILSVIEALLPALSFPAAPLSLLTVHYSQLTRESGSGPLIRVLLLRGKDKVSISSTDRFTIRDDRGRMVGEYGQESVSISRSGSEVQVEGKERAIREATFIPSEDTLLKTEGRTYRGELKVFVNHQNGLLAVNILPIEEYLRSVVPSEMPRDWPAEALKAQALAARTYALRKMEMNRELPWDVTDDVSDQVYLGTRTENPATDEAVGSTEGEVILYQREPIIAYYHSDAGGYTETREEFPYIVGVEAPAPASPYRSWTIEVTFDELRSLFRKTGKTIGEISRITTLTQGPSPRVKTITIYHSLGATTISGPQLRSLIGIKRMRSNNFRIELLADRSFTPKTEFKPRDRIFVTNGIELRRAPVRDLYILGDSAIRMSKGRFHTLQQEIKFVGILFRGSGYGHGMGLSQWGAYTMAEEGKDYREIIHHFYKDVTVEKRY